MFGIILLSNYSLKRFRLDMASFNFIYSKSGSKHYSDVLLAFFFAFGSLFKLLCLDKVLERDLKRIMVFGADQKYR